VLTGRDGPGGHQAGGEQHREVGVNLTRALFISGTWDPSRPMVTTMAAIRPTNAQALTRRTSSSNGSRTQS
jgi:hypothetical protein